MISAGIRALLVDGAASCFLIKVETISIGHSGQGEEAGLCVEMFNDVFFFQPFGNLFWIFFQIKFIYHPHANKIGHGYFYG